MREKPGICTEHAPKMQGVASAMGLPLQLIPLVNFVTEDAVTDPTEAAKRLLKRFDTWRQIEKESNEGK